MIQFSQVAPVTTGSQRIDTAINTGLVLGSVAVTLFAYFKGQQKQTATRKRDRAHIPPRPPLTRQRQEVDALNEGE